jgi:hypothetical protein
MAEAKTLDKERAKESDYAIVSRNWDRFNYGKDRGHFTYIEKARECENFYLGAGMQWSDEDLAYLKLIGRPAMEQNFIFPAVNTAKGLQLNSRVDIAFRPSKDGASEDTAEVLGKVVMQVCDDVKYKWHETQAFDDGIIQRRGFIEVKMDFNSNVFGDISCEAINPLHVIPDPDASSYDPKDWADVIVLRWLTIDEIESLYGRKKADEVNDTIGSTTRSDVDMDLEDIEGFAQEGSVATMSETATDERHVKRVLVIDRQSRHMEMQQAYIYLSGDIITAIGMSKEQEAAAVAAGAVKARRFLQRIRWTVTTADVLLHDKWSPYRTYTIIPYFPYFRRGRTRGMVDNCISPQIAVNKLQSATVHILNGTANSGWIIDQGALVNMTPAQLKDWGSQTGLVIEKVKGSIVEKIQPNRLPEGHDRLLERNELAIKSISGISDALQGLNSKEVSGVALNTKQYMGQTQMGGPLDNLARSRHLVSCKFLELIQDFYTAKRVIMITDTSDIANIRSTPLVINDVDELGNVINDLTIGEYSVVVTDQPTQATFQDNQFQQAMEMRKQGIGIPDPAIIEMSSLTKKHQIAKAMSEQTPTADPLNEAKADDLKASAELKRANAGKVANEMVNVGVDAQYSAVQAAGTLATNPMLAPLADQMLRSSGFKDQDAAPIIPNNPAGPGQQIVPMAGDAASNLAGPQAQLPMDAVQPPQAGPSTVAAPPTPDTSGPDGMQAGIETPVIEGM